MRDVQVTLQNVHHPRRTRMGRDWPVMLVMRVESTESHVLVAKNRLACAAPPALELYVERV